VLSRSASLLSELFPGLRRECGEVCFKVHASSIHHPVLLLQTLFGVSMVLYCGDE
jgi:hypothetical protein